MQLPSSYPALYNSERNDIYGKNSVFEIEANPTLYSHFVSYMSIVPEVHLT